MLLGQDRIRIAGKGWTGVEGKRSPAPGVFEWKLAKSPCE
jgi:hypothetical protein